MNPIQLSFRQIVAICFISVNHKAAGKAQEFGTNEKSPCEASVSFENKPPLCLDNGPLTTVNFT